MTTTYSTAMRFGQIDDEAELDLDGSELVPVEAMEGDE